MNFLGQIDLLDGAQQALGLPGWVYVAIALFGAGGFWAWLKLYTSKRFDQWTHLWNHALRQENEIGSLKEALAQLKADLKASQQQLDRVRAAYRWLADVSRAEINRLRAKLSMPALDRWPPDRREPPAERRADVVETADDGDEPPRVSTGP